MENLFAGVSLQRCNPTLLPLIVLGGRASSAEGCTPSIDNHLFAVTPSRHQNCLAYTAGEIPTEPLDQCKDLWVHYSV